MTKIGVSSARHKAESARFGLAAAMTGLLCLTAWFSCRSAHAVPACPAGVEVKQPDGTKFTLFLRGDEFAHWNEDADGYLVVKSPDTGFWMYARQEAGAIVATKLVVGRDDPKAAGLSKADRASLCAKGKERATRPRR